MSNDFIPAAKPLVGKEEQRAVDAVLASGMMAQGPQVAAFEEEFSAQMVDGAFCAAVNSGTSALHQQLVFRPTPGLGRPETPVPGLYLASASAHPGGGVHGAPGWNAARAALSANSRVTGSMRRALTRTAWARLLPRS